MSAATPRWCAFVTLIGILAIVGVALLPYGGNITSVFHTDTTFADRVSPGFVILQVPGYDGAQYEQVARNIPAFFSPSSWQELRSHPPLSYAYQRFLAPLVAFVVALGNADALPYTFLVLNILTLTLASWVVARWTRTALPALAYAFCPSAMVALHFQLAEPLALLLLALFLTRFLDRKHIRGIEALLLSLLVLSREVNVLFAGFVLLYVLWRGTWRDVIFAALPLCVFLAFHGFLYLVFGDIPFLISAGARQLPGSAAVKLLLGMRGFNRFTLSSIALFLGFVLPAWIWMLRAILRGARDIATIGAFLFLCLMLTMPDYIWGSITSIGRVITPVYPLSIFALAQSNTRTGSLLMGCILLLGLAAGLGLALTAHPFTLAP